MNFIYDTQKALSNLQDRVIGLFKIHGTTHIDLVVEVDRDLLKTVTIGSLGGISVTHIPSSKGQLILFENGESLTDIKKNPFQLQGIVNDLNTNK